VQPCPYIRNVSYIAGGVACTLPAMLFSQYYITFALLSQNTTHSLLCSLRTLHTLFYALLAILHNLCFALSEHYTFPAMLSQNTTQSLL